MFKLTKINYILLILTVIFTLAFPIPNTYATTYSEAFVKKQISYCGKNGVASLANQGSNSIMAWWNSLVEHDTYINGSTEFKKLYNEVSKRLKQGRFLIVSSKKQCGILSSGKAIRKVELASVKTITFSGHKYRLYKQTSYKYTGSKLNPTGEKYVSISRGGCLPTSLCIIASGYNIYLGNYLINPASFVTYRWSGVSNYTNAKNQATKANLKLGSKYYLSSNKSKLLKYAKDGIPILVHASKGYYTSGGHYMAVIGYSSNYDKVYLSDPNSSSKSGYVSVNTLLERGIDWFTPVYRYN